MAIVTAKAHRSGEFDSGYFSEYNEELKFDSTIHVEPDGSQWLHVFHHNNPSGVSFSSTDTFTTGVYKDADRWFNLNACNVMANTWEFLAVQSNTAGATPGKWRWIQTANPFTATFANVAMANITRITSGYSSWSGSYGGIYKLNSSTYMCQNNGTSGSWWGATGAWTKHQSGAPGYNGNVCTTGCMDLYLRIDTDNMALPNPLTNFRILKSGSVESTDFIEY